MRTVNYFTERIMKMETQDCLKPINVTKPYASTSNVVPRVTGMQTEWLPFTVKLATSEEDLAKAVSIRYQAYARHLPAVAATLDRPESLDREEGTVVVLAESKLDGTPIGTMRIQNNRNKKLALEHSVDLPEWLRDESKIELARFGVADGRIGRLVKTVLVKAGFQYCLLNDIDWLVIAARSPLDRQYEKLMFQDVFPDLGFIPMQHAGNIPHRVLAFDVVNAYERWTTANHPLFNFMCKTHHPDLQLANRDASIEAVVARLPVAYQHSGLNPLVIVS
jgi:hypothetical protein